jgi:phage terminase small subunit
MCPYTAIYVSTYREARKEGGIVTNKEAGKECKPATLTHMQNASRRTAMRAAMEAGAVRTLLVLLVQQCKY